MYILVNKAVYKRIFTKTILTYGKDVTTSSRTQTTEVLLRWKCVRQAVGRALYKVKYVKFTDIAKFAGHLPHRYGNSRAIWDHTVLPATRQRRHSRLYPSQSWYSIKRPQRDARLS